MKTEDRKLRIRRILKWTGVVLCFAILSTSIVSMNWQIYYQWENERRVFRAFAAQKASLYIIRQTQLPASNRIVLPGWGTSTAIGDVLFYPNLLRGSIGYVVSIPLWIPFFLVALPTVWLIIKDRRRILPEHCRRCGYNLKGNTSGRCSECGVPIID